MDYFLEEDALRASATYAKQFITQAVFISSDDKVLIWKTACQESSMKGLHLEFGVHTALSLNCLAKMKPKQLGTALIVFLGLQENWRGGYYPKHFFSTYGLLPEVEPNVKLIKGWFNEPFLNFLLNIKEL